MCERILSHFIAGPSLGEKEKKREEKKRKREGEKERGDGVISAKIGKRISS